MPTDSTPLMVDAAGRASTTVLTVRGVLTSVTYRGLRDRIIKAALDAPIAVVVDVTALDVPAESAWSVFTSARWHVARWPEVPILLACGTAAGRAAIRRNGISRYVPVYTDVAEAVAAALASDPPRARRRARVDLPADPSSPARARQFVTERLITWGQQSMVPTAKVVVTAFVENVLAHTSSDADVRLETDGTLVTVAVEDGSRMPAGVLEEVQPLDLPSGLKIVSALCRTWGNAPTPTGKTVWAVLGPENAL